MAITERAPRAGEAKEAQEQPSQFSHNRYDIKRRIGRLGIMFDLSANGKFVMRAQRELFHLTKNFHVYADQDKKDELLAFKTRGSVPQTYDIDDPESKKRIGSVRHNISQSFPRTHWDILSDSGETLATLRRMKVNKAWHRYGPKALFYPSFEIVTPDERTVTTIQQKFSPLTLKMQMDVQNPQTTIDRRLLVAANIILAEREYLREKANS